MATFEGTPDSPDQPFESTTLAGVNSSLRVLNEHTALRQEARWLNLDEHPTHVILDAGCTRCMGSRPAVEKFVKAATARGCWCEWQRCHTKMSVANSAKTTIEWCVVVHFPTDPPLQTTIDVCKEGSIPILSSLPQMMNLGFVLDMNAECVKLTCPALNCFNATLAFSYRSSCCCC